MSRARGGGTAGGPSAGAVAAAASRRASRLGGCPASSTRDGRCWGWEAGVWAFSRWVQRRGAGRAAPGARVWQPCLRT